MPEDKITWLPFNQPEWVAIRLMRSSDVIENKTKQIYELADNAFEDEGGFSLVEASPRNPKEMRKALQKPIKRLKTLMPKYKKTNFLMMIDHRLAREAREEGKPVQMQCEKNREWHLRMKDLYRDGLSMGTSKAAKKITDAKPGIICFMDLDGRDMSPASFYRFMKTVEEIQRPTLSKKALKRLQNQNNPFPLPPVVQGPKPAKTPGQSPGPTRPQREIGD